MSNVIKESEEVIAEPKAATVVEKELSPQEKKRAEWKARFSKYADLKPNKIRDNMQLRAEMSSALKEALGELPSAKYLVQKSEGAVSNTIYDELISKIFSEQEEVPAGSGAEYCLVNGMVVNALDPSKFIPDSRNDIENYMYWDSIAIPTAVNQAELTIATWMYFQYFLSGKVDEVANIVREEVQRSIKLKAQYDLLQIPKQIFQTVYAKASSTSAAPTNHLSGTKTYIVDAVKEWLDFIFPMLSHNKQFAYNASFTGYNNAVEADLVHICNHETYNNIIKVATTFLAKEQFETFSKVNKFVVLPPTIFNSTAGVGDIEKLNILSDTTGNRVQGAILTLDRRGLKRLYNLESTYSEFFPKNLTDVVWANYRYAQGCLKWAQVAVYNNPALEQDFFLPTQAA